MADVLLINGKTENVFDAEDFARMLREKLGEDAERYHRDLLKDAIEDVAFDTENCPGECDKMYEQQQEYEAAIGDAIDELECGNVQQAIRILRNAT